MKEELELKLVKKYPSLYRNYKGDPMHTCMAWGFECGDGWYDLIDELSYDITRFAKKRNVDIVAEQVKSKFGSLRYYYSTNLKSNWFGRKMFNIRLLLCKHGMWKQVNYLSSLRKKIYKTKSEKISDIIGKAEIESYKTCEKCGNYGTFKTTGWKTVLCGRCYFNHLKNRRG